MIIRNLKSRRRLVALAVFTIVALSAFGFAAANTVPASNAGDGSGAISGYTATNVHYTLNAVTPSNLAAVQFDIAPAVSVTSTVRVSVDGGTTWLAAGACSGTTTVTCNVASSVLGATSLRIIAAQ
jgi:hypothetical protein